MVNGEMYPIITEPFSTSISACGNEHCLEIPADNLVRERDVIVVPIVVVGVDKMVNAPIIVCLVSVTPDVRAGDGGDRIVIRIDRITSDLIRDLILVIGIFPISSKRGPVERIVVDSRYVEACVVTKRYGAYSLAAQGLIDSSILV